jgi:membrane protein DedA with SNARE-associated domain
MWESWIETYGYVVVLLGTVLEGETVLVLAGYSVSRGYLELLPIFLLAVFGATAGDSAYYWIGRRYGTRALRGYRSLRPIRARAALGLRRWGPVAALVTRFAYGLRFAMPVLIGASRVRPLVFHTYNLLGAILFAALYLGIGILFGEALQTILERVRPYESRVFLTLIALGLAFWVIREWRLYRSVPPEAERALAEIDRIDRHQDS